MTEGPVGTASMGMLWGQWGCPPCGSRGLAAMQPSPLRAAQSPHCKPSWREATGGQTVETPKSKVGLTDGSPVATKCCNGISERGHLQDLLLMTLCDGHKPIPQAGSCRRQGGRVLGSPSMGTTSVASGRTCQPLPTLVV